MELFLSRLFDGLTLGSIYAVVALALVLIFKATTLINFAQGEMAMLGTFFAYVFAVEQGLPVFIAIIIAMIISAVLAAGVERVLIRPFDPDDHLPVVIITLGLFLVINAVAGEIWRYDPRNFPSPFPADFDDYVSIGGARLFYEAVGIWVSLGAILLVLYVLLNKTKVGLAFRAVSSNVESARLAGIRTGRTLQFGWALAAAMGTLGGALVARRIFVEPNMMQSLLIFSLTAAALGGLDSLGGAVIGGLIIGLVQSLLVGYAQDIPGLDWLSGDLSLAVAFVAILIVLMVRPSGLFGTRRVERV
ncbi:MAG: branched-chain amino acid ABC transporter permease [Actinomycetota bacterium]|nr:branched-chain amino acid ABC transporter permease [Actinomycetota bacterium]